MKLLPYLILIILQAWFAHSGKMYTPIHLWHKVACLPEEIKASGRYICDQKGKVICLPGWANEKKACAEPACDFDGESCVHGNCTKPNQCTCEIGWQGVTCDECVCLPGCENGYCEEPMECRCEEGWKGMFCNKPECGPCTHGFCSGPGVCTCHPGYEGVDCETCIPNPDCQYGTCRNNPFECDCYDGFEGLFCHKPICREGCHPEHGMCLQPEECWCRAGWEGENCDQCIRSANCVNGFCDEPFECKCNEGFFGKDCNATVAVDGNWGQWGTWSECDVDGCKQTRNRACDDPPPSGGGWYCSKDGSYSFEERTCIDTAVCDGSAIAVVTNWSVYGPCSQECGGGVETRTRTCSTGNPADCSAGTIFTQERSCNVECCVVDGSPNDWTEYGPCDKICIGDIGERVRRRFCNNPEPACGGRTCLDQGFDIKESESCTGIYERQATDHTKPCFSINGK